MGWGREMGGGTYRRYLLNGFVIILLLAYMQGNKNILLARLQVSHVFICIEHKLIFMSVGGRGRKQNEYLPSKLFLLMIEEEGHSFTSEVTKTN